MLRVTVTRETAMETVSIGEVVIGKFSGTVRRGGYAARIHEPPSLYSEGIDACFTVRGHQRYQPAMALVASVLAAWSDGRIDAVGLGVRAVLLNAAGNFATAPGVPGPGIPGPSVPGVVAAPAPSAGSTTERAARVLIDHPDDPVFAALATAILAVADRERNGL